MMRAISCGVLLLLISVAVGQDRPKEDEPKPGGTQEVMISLADTPKAMADQIKAGSVVDIVIEEQSSSPSKTIFLSRQVTVVVDDKRKKDGHTVTVNLTRAQAQAFDSLKSVSKVTLELHKDSAKDPSKGKKNQTIEPDSKQIQAAREHCDNGLGYYHAKKYDKAISEFTEAIRLDPDNSYYIKTRGIIYRASGDLARAFADLNEAIRIRPDYAAALVERGITHAAKKDFDRAIGDYTKAIEVHPNYALAYEKRSLAYASKSDKERAQADLREAQRLEKEKAKSPMSEKEERPSDKPMAPRPDENKNVEDKLPDVTGYEFKTAPEETMTIKAKKQATGGTYYEIEFSSS
jgi:tetratricopeptide (TPR) repeat protein